MNLDELRTVQSKERQKDSLQHLRPSFYQEVADYISDLKAERERVADAADDPFSSPEVGRLTDEIETAKDVVEAIYERRMGKLVKQASLAAAGMPANDEGLTAEEQDLFEDLISRIESNKGRVLDVLEGSASSSSEAETETASESNPDTAHSPDSSVDRTAGPDDVSPESVTPESESESNVPPTPPQEPPMDDPDGGGVKSETPARDDTATDTSVSAADVMGGDVPSSRTNAADSDADSVPSDSDSNSSGDHERKTTDEPADSAAADVDTADSGSNVDVDSDTDRTVDRVTVRITRDVGSILGVDDREYTLSNDDVVTLPEQNATPLVERDAAEQLE
ncbi:hypothetical protein OB955_02615 [Halobacteria archaeon AArc-m2/3/4]|uniref:Gins51 C-terminal domain-containing protein n=1 Tax=Natronoglomus mannanivorans TaxID=2979990 RepID=A0ABT2Q9M8_9EURY|nr:hypothetical protein [Halobacteria archaeon AArc-m2/3/4]